jgi:hypothetical protein
MRKQHAIGIAAALALLGQQPSWAQVSANDVMPACRDFLNGNTRDALAQGMCAGIVRAMFFYGKTRFEFCRPDEAPIGQGMRVVVAYIEQRPARMHEPFEVLALDALQQAWPCGR